MNVCHRVTNYFTGNLSFPSAESTRICPIETYHHQMKKHNTLCSVLPQAGYKPRVSMVHTLNANVDWSAQEGIV